MTNALLIEVIKAAHLIKPEELAPLLTSPLFNKGGNSKEMLRLYQLIYDTAPGFSPELLDKRKIYKQLFLNEKEVPRKLDKLMSDLNRALKSYFLTSQYLADENEHQQVLDWSKWLRERGLLERSKQIITKQIQELEMQNLESREFYLKTLQLAEESHEWESTHNKAKGDLGIPRVVVMLDRYYHNFRIELENRYLLQQTVANLSDFDLLIKDCSEKIGNSTLLQISRNINKMLKGDSPSKDDFYILLYALKKEEGKITYEAQAEYYSFLRSICSIMINSGHIEFVPALHVINKDSLDKGYFLFHGEIPPNSYLNLVQTATRAKDYIWAKQFTINYKDLIIGGDEHHFFFRLNMAHCHFEEGEYEKALDILPESPSISHYHQMVRRLEIKIYYELRSDLLPYKCDAFRKYLARTASKAIPKEILTANLQFLNILQQLSQIHFKNKMKSLRLQQRVEEKKLVAERAWLIEKARELG